MDDSWGNGGDINETCKDTLLVAPIVHHQLLSDIPFVCPLCCRWLRQQGPLNPRLHLLLTYLSIYLSTIFSANFGRYRPILYARNSSGSTSVLLTICLHPRSTTLCKRVQACKLSDAREHLWYYHHCAIFYAMLLLRRTNSHMHRVIRHVELGVRCPTHNECSAFPETSYYLSHRRADLCGLCAENSTNPTLWRGGWQLEVLYSRYNLIIGCKLVIAVRQPDTQSGKEHNRKNVSRSKANGGWGLRSGGECTTYATRLRA